MINPKLLILSKTSGGESSEKGFWTNELGSSWLMEPEGSPMKGEAEGCLVELLDDDDKNASFLAFCFLSSAPVIGEEASCKIAAIQQNPPNKRFLLMAPLLIERQMKRIPVAA